MQSAKNNPSNSPLSDLSALHSNPNVGAVGSLDINVEIAWVGYGETRGGIADRPI